VFTWASERQCHVCRSLEGQKANLHIHAYARPQPSNDCRPPTVLAPAATRAGPRRDPAGNVWALLPPLTRTSTTWPALTLAGANPISNAQLAQLKAPSASTIVVRKVPPLDPTS
jgi:hypothetical protein